MKVFRPLVADTRKEVGSIVYDCCEKRGTNNIIIFEKYQSEVALNDHMKTSHFLEVYPQVVKLIDGNIEVSRCPKLI